MIRSYHTITFQNTQKALIDEQYVRQSVQFKQIKQAKLSKCLVLKQQGNSDQLTAQNVINVFGSQASVTLRLPSRSHILLRLADQCLRLPIATASRLTAAKG